jgi:glutamate synthase (NADPH/NADH)
LLILGAKSVVNFELLPKPPVKRASDNPWPQYPRIFRVDYGHAEAGAVYNKDPREYCVLSKEFVSNGEGAVKGINTVSVEWVNNDGSWKMSKIENSERFYPADLVLLAMGFLGPEKELISQLGVSADHRSNIETTKGKYSTSIPGIFAAGDCHRGQSLIVWAINEGRQAAREIDLYLMGSTRLPVCGGVERRPVEFLASRSAAGLVGIGIQTEFPNEVVTAQEEK